VNCSNCGGHVPVDAGFCRNCGAILRGRSASATVIPSSVQAGASPPVSGPEPPPPPLADAGYFGPPLDPAWPRQPHDASTGGQTWSVHDDGTSSEAGQETRTFMPTPRRPSPAAHSPTTSLSTRWGTDSRQSGKYSAEDDERMRRHMLALDYGIIAASGLVVLSTAINWYQASVVVAGERETLRRHLLSGSPGTQRWLVPIVAGLILTEVLLNMVWLRSSHREWKLHRGSAMFLCVADAVLVVNAMAASPFGGANLNNLGIQLDLGPGAWVALCGALVGIIAAFARMFAGRPALTRSAPTRSR
jgi:hypothetical protein